MKAEALLFCAACWLALAALLYAISYLPVQSVIR